MLPRAKSGAASLESLPTASACGPGVVGTRYLSGRDTSAVIQKIWIF